VKDLIAGVASSLVGFVSLLIALGLGGERALFFSKAEATTGTVVELRESRFSNTTRRGKYPVIELSTPGGQRRRFEGGSSYPPKYRVGEPVAVVYDPADPKDARVDSFTELWLFPTLAGGLAALFVPLGATLLLLRARRVARERLRATGVAVVGVVTAARTSSVEEWGKTVQVLTVAIVDPRTGARRELDSHRTPGKGDEWIGKSLTVWVDPKNVERYLVDAPYPG